MNNNDIKFKKFYSELHDILKIYHDDGKLNLSEKVRSKDIEFLSEISLLGINFNMFKDENKNTKKTIVNYLYEFYMICNFLTYSGDGNMKLTKELFDDIQKMVNGLSTQVSVVENKRNGEQSMHQHQHQQQQPLNTNLLPDISSLLPGMDSTFMNLMQNKDIMNIATELSSEIRSQDIDPMSIMSSLMSGNLNDGKIGDLINSISSKLTQKIDSGEIDKNMLETHASSFMNTLSSNKDFMSFAKKTEN